MLGRFGCDGSDRVDHPICYFSQNFENHQKHYSTIEREVVPMTLAVNHSDVYMYSASLCQCTHIIILLFYFHQHDEKQKPEGIEVWFDSPGYQTH